MLPTKYTVTSESTWAIIPTTDIRGHARISSSDDDALLASLVTAASSYYETINGHALRAKMIKVYLDRWPDGNDILLPLPPLRSVTSVKYIDSTGSTGTMPATDYHVDTVSLPPRVTLSSTGAWPTTTLRTSNPIYITCAVGSTSSDAIPALRKQAVKFLTLHWYEHREAYEERASRELPLGLNALIEMDRVYSW